ncbi:hypothetical protein [Streptomyces lichenis]|uniref:DUF397 domain-containing protein n=1 Tax=Streptomyces lichenis TaxID=2306967 RepID=A0ABT0I5J3_9ACTN|nr:hypothetical protein [Streptomyces lichenis]MCK8676571.1 hypothetical protein [Streptomyces lichenis]
MYSCAHCPDPGADVCIRISAAVSGPDYAVYAHRVCADERGEPVLYAVIDPAPAGNPVASR